MIKTLEEIQKEYEEQIKIKEQLNALSLPTGKNNMYTLTYISFYENKNLTLLQKGILIHLYIRGGHIRVVKHSKNKLAKTLGISVGAISNNIKKLEEMKYLKSFKKIVEGNNSKEADLLYLYPIEDKKGIPITSSEEEIKYNIEYMINLLNKESSKFFKAEEKELGNYEEIPELDMELELEHEIKEKLDRNINTPVHLTFMENPLLTINDKVIYLYLKLRSGQYNVFFESKLKTASKLNISDKTFTNSLKKLIELNYITKYHRFSTIDGVRSSDVLYLNYYDNHTGLPDINESLMMFNIDLAIKNLLNGYKLIKVNVPKSKTYLNELFTKQIKNLLELDNNISDIYYDTFIEPMKFEINNDIIRIIIPRHLNSMKESIYNNLSSFILNYAKAISKVDTDFYITIESKNLKNSS